MKFGQLIEYKNIFLEKSYTKCGGETISRLFSKKSKYLWINSLLYILVLLYARVKAIDIYIEIKLQITIHRIQIKFFKKNRGFELVSLTHFPHYF